MEPAAAAHSARILREVAPMSLPSIYVPTQNRLSTRSFFCK
jgi:hypothetical protein